MCFSAPVSFATSGLLAIAGGASMRKAKKSQRLVAAIPLLFSAQQFIEGLQWLAVRAGESSQVLAYGFLFFAFLVWPVYIPVTAYFNENVPAKKNILKYFVGVGALISLYLLISLFTQPLFVNSSCCGIGYEIRFPFWQWVGPAYVLVLCGSAFISSDKYFRIFSVLTFISAAIAYFVFYLKFTSVWCFFAAALSLLIYIYFWKKSIIKK